METFRYKLFIFFFSLSATVFASQKTKIDSLLKLTSSKNKTEVRLDAYLQISGIVINTSPDSAFIYAKKALKLANETKDISSQIQAENMMGNCHQRQGNYDKALKAYNKCLKLAEKSNDLKGLAQATNNIGIVYTNKGEYDKALEAYQNSMQYERQRKDKNGEAEALNNIGVIHYYMGNMDQTIKYFEEAVLIEEELGNDHLLKKGYNNLGAIMEYTKDYKGALSYYEKSYKLSEKLNDKQEMSLVLNNIAGIYQDTKQLEKAKEIYLKSLALKNEIGDKNGIALIYINLGIGAEKRGNHSEAIQYFQKSLDLSTSINSKPIMKEAYGNLAAIYEKLGDYKNALNSQIKLNAIKDSLINEEKTKAITEMEAKYQSAEKERMLLIEKNKSAELEKENAIKEKNVAIAEKKTAEAQEAEAKSRNLAIGLAGGVVALFFLGLFIIQRNRRKAQAEKDAVIIEEREKGLHAVIDAAENERRRIAKDLHDGIGQQLTGVKMAMQQLTGENDKIKSIENIINETSLEVRSLSHRMMPKMLEEDGLLPALEDLFKKTFGLNNIPYEFNQIGLENRVDSKIELSVYRVAQEIVNNILKHAQATQIMIDVMRKSDKLIFLIEDNGKGFDPNKKSGLGLQNMETRLSTISGKINIDSEIGKGSSFTINIPL